MPYAIQTWIPDKKFKCSQETGGIQYTPEKHQIGLLYSGISFPEQQPSALRCLVPRARSNQAHVIPCKAQEV